MERNKILDFLKNHQLSEARIRHALGVESVALQLAERFGAPLELVTPATLLHDLCREYRPDLLLKLATKFDIVIDDIERREPILLHGPVAAELIRDELGLAQPDLLEAVRYHTIGAPYLSPLARLVFVADAIEPGRSYPDAGKLYDQAMTLSPERLLLQIYDLTIQYSLIRGYLVSPSTIAGRNEIIMKGV